MVSLDHNALSGDGLKPSGFEVGMPRNNHSNTISVDGPASYIVNLSGLRYGDARLYYVIFKHDITTLGCIQWRFDNLFNRYYALSI